MRWRWSRVEQGVDSVSAVVDGADPAALDGWAAQRRRIFIEVASPAATRMKHTVYDSDRPTAERTCAELRQMIEDPVAFRDRLTFPIRLRSSRVPV